MVSIKCKRGRMILINKRTFFLILAMLLAACRPISTTIQPIPSPSLVSPSAAIYSSLQKTIPQPCLTPAAMPEKTMTPTQPASEYCEHLLANYHPAYGYETYCDTQYGFALDYPNNWTKTTLDQSPDIASLPSAVRKVMLFHTEDMSNFIRTNTYHIYGILTLRERMEYSLGYNDRAFPDKTYPSLVLGGHRAYAIMECNPQAYNSVNLYFQHGQYYTVMDVKEINRSGLDTNWQIARSIQTPGYTPENNVIPQELIDDSYQLADCYMPPTQISTLAP
jgi:hypothetical protein